MLLKLREVQKQREIQRLKNLKQQKRRRDNNDVLYLHNLNSCFDIGAELLHHCTKAPKTFRVCEFVAKDITTLIGVCVFFVLHRKRTERSYGRGGLRIIHFFNSDNGNRVTFKAILLD